MIVLVDMDGPLANFEAGFLKAWRLKYPYLAARKLEDRRSFYVREDYPRDYRNKVESIYFGPGFYRSLPVVEGAQEALTAMMSSGVDVRVCTAPLSRYENCVLEKYEWINQHLGPELIDRVVMAKDKTLVLGDYLIDDRPIVEGAYPPAWEHIIFDMPYNRATVTTARRLTSWRDWRTVLGMET